MQSFIYDNIKWYKTNTGYYTCHKTKQHKRQTFHRYIWEKHNGTIPDGYVIHHIDHNKENNNLNNLKCMSSDEHSRYHASLRVYDKDEYTWKWGETTSKSVKCSICGTEFIKHRNEWNRKKSKEKTREKHNGLTTREFNREQNKIKVLELKAKGLKQREIAQELGVTQQYVSKILISVKKENEVA